MHIPFNASQIPLRIGTQKNSHKYSLQPFWNYFQIQKPQAYLIKIAHIQKNSFMLTYLSI